MRNTLVIGCFALAMLGNPAHSEGFALSDERFDVSIRDQNVRDVLDELSAAIGVPILVSDAVTGRVNAAFDNASATQLLNRIADDRALDWRFDGRRIQVTARSEQTTRIMDLDGVRLAELSEALTALGVHQQKFPITAVDGEFAMIVAPPGYTALVEVVLGALVERHAEARLADEKAMASAEERRLEQRRLDRMAAVERSRAETALMLEEQRARNLRLQAIQRELDRRVRRGPVVVRNGVWGG